LRILDFNFVFQSNVTKTSSSSDSEFPVANLENQIRGKIFRTAGFFKIDATNNKIDFNEGAGALVATITVGDYSVSGLQTAIKTALEVLGLETYTVSFSALTGKWTISHAGATLSLLWSTGVNSGTSIGSTLGFDTSVDDTGAITYTGAAVALHTSEWAQIDLNTAEPIDSFCMFFDPRLGINFSEQAVIRLQANATPNFDSPSVNITLSIDETNRVISHFFTTDQSFRFWRVDIADPKNANLHLDFGKIVLAKATVLTRIPANGFSYTKRDMSKIFRSTFGHVYSDKLPKVQEMVFKYNFFENADLRLLRQVYENVGKSDALVVAFDPLESVFDKDEFLIYGNFIGDIKIRNQVKAFFSGDLRIRESF